MKHKRELGPNFHQEWLPGTILRETFIGPRPKIKLSRRIDLHGLTLHDAYVNTVEFIQSHIDNGSDSIRIVTGASGNIKKEFVSWILKTKCIKKYLQISNGEYKIWLRNMK